MDLKIMVCRIELILVVVVVCVCVLGGGQLFPVNETIHYLSSIFLEGDGGGGGGHVVGLDLFNDTSFRTYWGKRETHFRPHCQEEGAWCKATTPQPQAQGEETDFHKLNSKLQWLSYASGHVMTYLTWWKKGQVMASCQTAQSKLSNSVLMSWIIK